MNRKKNLEIREGSQEQWKHTSTHWNFFSPFTSISYEHLEKFPCSFWYAPLLFVDQWKQEKF